MRALMPLKLHYSAEKTCVIHIYTSSGKYFYCAPSDRPNLCRQYDVIDVHPSYSQINDALALLKIQEGYFPSPFKARLNLVSCCVAMCCGHAVESRAFKVGWDILGDKSQIYEFVLRLVLASHHRQKDTQNPYCSFRGFSSWYL